MTSLDAGREGVLERPGEHRFTAHPLATKTVLTKSQTKGGRVLRASVIDGRWGVPVELDGEWTFDALSPDGRWLYLIEQLSPRDRTRYAVRVYDLESTVRRTSLCLDLLHRVAGRSHIWAMRLAVRKDRVAVLHGDRIVASAARRPRRASVGGGPPWLAAAVAAAGLLLAASGARRAQAVSRRRRELR